MPSIMTPLNPRPSTAATFFFSPSCLPFSFISSTPNKATCPIHPARPSYFTTMSSSSLSPSPNATQSEPDSRFAEIDSVTVHHKLFPSTSNTQVPLAICLHGFGANLSSFEICSQQLCSLFNFVAYDTPGFGLTTRPSSLSFYTSIFSSRITTSLAHAYNTNNNKYVLIAHSLGSISAAYTTIKNPSEILAVILIAPAILPSSSSSNISLMTRLSRFIARTITSISVILTALLTPLLIPLLRFIVTPESFWRNSLNFARGPNTQCTDDVVAKYRQPVCVEGWEAGILNFTRATLKERSKAIRLQSNDYLGNLADLPIELAPPMLIVHGEKDKLVPLENSKRIADTLNKSTLVIMKDVGHVPHEENSSAFVDIVRKFMAENVVQLEQT